MTVQPPLSIDIGVGEPLNFLAFVDEKESKTLYAYNSPIAAGASASVLRGVMLNKQGSATHVALKVLPIATSDVKRQLLQREINAWRSLRHPYILPFLGSCELKGRHEILISAFMKNGNLYSYLQKHPEADKRTFLLQIAQAVDFLHNGAQIVHGDLKCENVLVSDDGDALLADFGLSTTTQKSNFEDTTCTDIRGLYTLRFCAPEVLLGTPHVSETASLPQRPRSKTCASDVYAFGMLALQAITGKIPWVEFDGPGQIILQVTLGCTPSRPTSFTEDDWWRLCTYCWSFNPRDRPSIQSVAQVLAALTCYHCAQLHFMHSKFHYMRHPCWLQLRPRPDTAADRQWLHRICIATKHKFAPLGSGSHQGESRPVERFEPLPFAIATKTVSADAASRGSERASHITTSG